MVGSGEGVDSIGSFAVACCVFAFPVVLMDGDAFTFGSVDLVGAVALGAVVPVADTDPEGTFDSIDCFFFVSTCFLVARVKVFFDSGPSTLIGCSRLVLFFGVFDLLVVVREVAFVVARGGVVNAALLGLLGADLLVRGGVCKGREGDFPHSLIGWILCRSASFHTAHCCCVKAFVGVRDKRWSGSSSPSLSAILEFLL
jgi:hypothetical protein